MRTLVALNGMAAGAYLANKNYSGALMAANSAAVIAHLEDANEQRELSNRINHAILEGQQNQTEQFARFANNIEQTMGYLATGLEALHHQSEKQTQVMVHQLSTLVSLGERLDTQIDLMAQGNRFAEKASETRSAEMFTKGLKCVSSLNHVPKSEHPEIADRAIGYFESAIQEDEFNEQAELQAAIWKCFRHRPADAWLRHYRKAKAVALTELRNSDPGQARIAEQTIEALAAAAPLDLVKNGQHMLYLDEFADFCLQHCSENDRVSIQTLTCAAMMLAVRPMAKIMTFAEDISEQQGWPFLINSLMGINGVVQSERFLDLLEILCRRMQDWESECADAAAGIFQ